MSDKRQVKYPGNSLERLQEVQRELLGVFDRVCREQGLTYFIDSGTCLGAVRHGGFIPWDDDIDVGMPYDDYVRFLEIAPQVLPDGYGLYTPDNNPNQAIFSAKLVKEGTCFSAGELKGNDAHEGIFIDVFPYCRLDSNPKVAAKQVKTARFWQSLSYLRHVRTPHIPKKAPFKPLLKAGCLVAHFTVAQLWSTPQMRDKVFRAFQDADGQGNWTSVCYTAYGQHDDATLFPVKEVTFDDMRVFAPHDCDGYLRNHFGDYMTLPPEDERYTHAPAILDFGDGINVIEA
ncbi:MAG: LicD family protein [Coriobacteriales bacterium]|nr:LicD family protein [Coriobacteriales bacterium]